MIIYLYCWSFGLHNNLIAYFPEENDHCLKVNMFILQRFNDASTEDEELLELRADLNQKVSFQKMDYSRVVDFSS